MNQTALENMNPHVDTSNILTQAAAYTINDGGNTPVRMARIDTNDINKNSTISFQKSFDQYYLGGANSSNKHLKTLTN